MFCLLTSSVYLLLLVLAVADLSDETVHFLGTEKSSLQDETVRHQKRYEEIIRDKKTLDMLSVRVVNLGIPRSGKKLCQ